MGQERRVRRLELRAPDEALVRSGAILVEDALRTASLPGADRARLYVVRRLSLGAIDVRRPAATVALCIERRMAELELSAVPATGATAARAPAVYFEDDLEPIALLVARLAAGRPATEWFWPLAVPGFSPLLPAAAALRLLLERALDGPARAVAAARVVAGLDAGAIDCLCA